jgi:murein DD-endopeptidase MepM/ murein hydrolase activator NlpD
MAGYIDRSAEIEALRFTNASQEAQLNTFAERIASLDNQLTLLKNHETDLAEITSEFNTQLGLEDNTTLAELLPHLNSTVAWAANNTNGVGGSEQLASPLGAAVAGSSRDLIRGMHRDIDRLMMEADDAEHYLASLKDDLSGARSILAATPTLMPLERRISADFGRRQNPFGGSSVEMHRGLDIPSPLGTVVRAPADGTVLSVTRAGGYGLLMTVDHGYGLVTRYAHLSSALLDPGADITRGQPIARTGNTGRSTGPHLHYETVLGGVTVNPLQMLPSQAAQTVVVDENSEALD